DRVDRERGKLAQVAAPAGLDRRYGGLGRLFLDAIREAAAQALVEHQRLEHVACDVRATDAAHDARAALAATHQHDVADARVARPRSFRAPVVISEDDAVPRSTSTTSGILGLIAPPSAL